jgi:hypothetical protein
MVSIQIAELDKRKIRSGQGSLGAAGCPWPVSLGARCKRQAEPTPNFFSAARRVADWAILLASSSNLSFIIFLSNQVSCYQHQEPQTTLLQYCLE